MGNRHPYRSWVPPVPAQLARPLWSVMIPTYNCAAYLRQTLIGVLAQDLGAEQMQIMVVDDHSTQDDPAAVVDDVGQGRVEFYQQPQNVGLTQNFQTCLELARGHLIHQLHGDDGVRDGFYRTMGQAFLAHPEIGAAFCRTIFINERNEWQHQTALERPTAGLLPRDWLQRLAIVCCIMTPSMVVRRSVYEAVGGFDHRFRCAAEDWEMWMRIATQYPVWYEPEPLALYRRHSDSSSGRNITNGRYGEDLYQAVRLFRDYLPDLPSPVFQTARQNCAFFALETADALVRQGDLGRSLLHIQAALRYCPSVRVIRSAARILVWTGVTQRLVGRWMAR